MSLEDEITKAISAHVMWKVWLRSAINAGKANASFVEVAKDNVCPFGQWLYGSTIPALARTSADYASVRELHADFHKCASNVLECVALGRKAEANALMDNEYFNVSMDLTAAMTKWKAVSH